MQLLASCVGLDEFDKTAWDAVGHSLRQNAGKLGDLGGGNHFLDALVDLKTWRVYFLVHTGSRLESGIVDALVESPREFDRKFADTVDWAKANRDAVTTAIERSFGSTELVLDLPHNTYEQSPSGSVIIRKGAVKVMPGETAVIPSYMAGDVSLVRATKTVSESLNSLSHGTGRALARGKAREMISDAEIHDVRRRIYVPDYIANESLRTDAPRCYRDLDTCLGLLGDTVVEEQRFAVIAYLGHL
jgi:RNA-splicing ligase RtcB